MSRLYCCALMPRSRWSISSHCSRPILNRAAMWSISASISAGVTSMPRLRQWCMDQPLVDQALEHFFAVAIDASGSQGVAADVLAVDHGHHVVLRPIDLRQLVGTALAGRASGPTRPATGPRPAWCRCSCGPRRTGRRRPRRWRSSTAAASTCRFERSRRMCAGSRSCNMTGHGGFSVNRGMQRWRLSAL